MTKNIRADIKRILIIKSIDERKRFDTQKNTVSCNNGRNILRLGFCLFALLKKRKQLIGT